MRDIIFRGKQITDKKWVMGGVDTSTDKKPYITRRAMYRPDTRDWDTAEYYEHNPHYTRACIDIIPETLGQFTGLTDKNGLKIFEGDICKFREWERGEMCWVGEVLYEHQQFIISGGPNEECSTEFFLQMSRFIPENIEVIGNIHDNPELLDKRG